MAIAFLPICKRALSKRWLLISCLMLLCLTGIRQIISAPARDPKTRDDSYSGGDDSLLTWSSAQQLDRAGNSQRQPRYTYVRTVENHSDQTVTDIYWPVAGYRRKLVPAHTSLSERIQMLGDLEIPQPKGQLYYGPGSTFYNTQVYAPKDGWTSSDRKRGAAESLTSELQVALRRNDAYDICTLRLTSTVSNSADGTQYRYEFKNHGASQVRVFWNIPGPAAFREQLKYTNEKPLVLNAEQSSSSPVTLNQPPASYLTTVFITDSDNQLVGGSIVAAWAPDNSERTISLKDEWRE